MKKWLILCVLIAIFSCTKKSTENSEILTYNVDDSTTDVLFNWPKAIKNDSLIMLETNDSVIIGSIKKVLVESNKYFILDGKNKQIIVFDSNGNYIFRIDNQGKGPEEYIELRDFCINVEANKIYILDYKKISEYNAVNGEYVNSYDFSSEINPLYLTIIKSGEFFLWNGTTTHNDNCLYMWDGKNLNGFIENDNYINETDRFIRNWDNSTLVVPPHGDFNIYSLNGDGIEVKYKIDFGSLNLPTNIIAQKDNIEEVDGNKYFKRFTNIRETEDWIYLLAIGPLKRYYEILIDKKTQKAYSGRFNSESSFWLVAADEKTFYAVVEPAYILESSNKSVLFKYKKRVKDEFENPAILKFSL